MLVSEGDLRCPPIHSDIAFTALRMAGVNAEMVRYPGEFHVMFVNGRPDRRIDRLERILDWFEKVPLTRRWIEQEELRTWSRRRPMCRS